MKHQESTAYKGSTQHRHFPITNWGRLLLATPILLIAVLTFGSVWANSAYGGFAYATNYGFGTISVIDTTTNQVSKTIYDGGLPFAIAASPDGSRSYVASYDRKVLVFDTDPMSPTSNTLVDSIPLTTQQQHEPTGIVVTADGKRVYVAANKAVYTIDTATRQVIAEVPNLHSAYKLTITPDDREVYVSNIYSNYVSVIENSQDPNDIQKIDDVPMKAGDNRYTNAFFVSTTPDGKYVYTTNTSQRLVSIIDTAKKEVVQTVSIASLGTDIAFTADGRYAYIGGYYPNRVMKLQTDTKQVIRSIAIPLKFTYAVGLDLSRDENRLYLADSLGGYHLGLSPGNGRVLVVDTEHNRLIDEVTTGVGTVDVTVID